MTGLRPSPAGRGIFAWIAVAAVLAALTLQVPQSIAFEESDPSTGLRDETGVLDDSEAREIEDRIADVEAAGAPTVVYLRLLHTEEDQAVEDGQRRMEAWELESEPGARDGVVFFFNLEPDDPNRGELGIVAGEAHYEGGALPQSELDRIRDEMIDDLSDDRMADGIVHGLALTAERLEAGPPEPSAFESFVKRVASGPSSILNIVSIALAAILGITGWRTWQDRPQARQRSNLRTTEPPEDEHPAIAGALAAGRVDHRQIEATMIVLGQRGAIQFEPDPEEDEQVRVRLIDRSLVETPYEARLLSTLTEHAQNDVLTQSKLQETQSDWSEIRDQIRAELEARGWFDPEASNRRRPLIIYGIVGILLGVIALFSLTIVEQPWPLVGAGSLVLAGIVLSLLAAGYPSTSLEGERAAVPWRGYRNGLRKAKDDEPFTVDLDEAVPYIVGMGLVSDYHDRLEKESDAGYVPTWFQMAEQHEFAHNTWFIYWVAFHGTMSPQTSGSGGTTAGGAAAGSGGAGGRF